MSSQLVWDLETAEPYDDVETWDSYKQRAGLGLAVVYDATWDDWEVYGPGDLVALVDRLEAASEVISYNGIGFDHLVLDAALGRRVFIAKETDLWQTIKAALGPEKWPKGSWTLNATCSRTLGRGKTGEGAKAPELLQAGLWGQVASYCIRDVKLTRDLWRFLESYGYVVDPEGRILQVGSWTGLGSTYAAATALG